MVKSKQAKKRSRSRSKSASRKTSRQRTKYGRQCTPDRLVNHGPAGAAYQMTASGNKYYCDEFITRTHTLEDQQIQFMVHTDTRDADILLWFDELIGCGSFNCTFAPSKSSKSQKRILEVFKTRKCLLRTMFFDDNSAVVDFDSRYKIEQELGNRGIGPKILSKIYKVKVENAEYIKKKENKRITSSHVKFYVVEDAGFDLFDMLYERRVKSAVKVEICSQIINLIYRLHNEAGYAHSDLHDGNVVVDIHHDDDEDDEATVVVKFIDFDRIQLLSKHNSVAQINLAMSDWVTAMKYFLSPKFKVQLQIIAYKMQQENASVRKFDDAVVEYISKLQQQ